MYMYTICIIYIYAVCTCFVDACAHLCITGTERFAPTNKLPGAKVTIQ